MTFRYTSSRCELPGEASYFDAVERILEDAGPEPVRDKIDERKPSVSVSTSTEPMPTAPPVWACTLIAGGVLLGMPVLFFVASAGAGLLALSVIGAGGIGAVRLLISPSTQKVK